MDRPRKVCRDSRARKRPEAPVLAVSRGWQLKEMAEEDGAQVLAVTVAADGRVSVVSSPGGMRAIARGDVLLPLLDAHGVLPQAQSSGPSQGPAAAADGLAPPPSDGGGAAGGSSDGEQ
eukprot:m51a1_g7041 hypothetical protein (119) ;mRNA; r:112261-112721